MKILRPLSTPLCFVLFLLVCAGISAQEKTETGFYFKPREQNLLIDIPLTIAEITAANIFGNIYWRLWGPDSEAAYFTADSIRENMHIRAWSFEKGMGGDTFLVNEFLHPYAGGIYFASARSNNFNFYTSMLASTFGSLQWEILGEADSPATNDLINSATGGFALG